MYTRLEIPSHCLKSIPRSPEDCRLYASDGASRCFHRNLLTAVSPALLKMLGTHDSGGTSGILLPVIFSNGLKALYDLVYTGRCIIPKAELKTVSAQLKLLKVETITRENRDENDNDIIDDIVDNSVDDNNDINDDNADHSMDDNVDDNIDDNIDENIDENIDDNEEDLDNVDEDEDDEEEDTEETKGMCQDTKDIIRITRYIRKILPRASTFQTSPESFECFICFKSLCNSAVWANHLMAQHFYQNFTCPTCGKKFNYFNVFNQHLYKFHGYRTNNPFKESPGRRKSSPKTELA